MFCVPRMLISLSVIMVRSAFGGQGVAAPSMSQSTQNQNSASNPISKSEFVIDNYLIDDEVQRDFNRAIELTRAGREDQALLSLTDFLRRYPRHSWSDDIQIEIANIYWARQNFEQALVEFQKVLSYNGKGADRRAEGAVGVGRCWHKLGRTDFARIEWQAVKRVYPGTSASAEADQLLMGF